MVFSNISEIENLDLELIDKEIILIAKELIDLRVKKATRQEFKPHQFKQNKRKLAQLLTIKNTKLAKVKN